MRKCVIRSIVWTLVATGLICSGSIPAVAQEVEDKANQDFVFAYRLLKSGERGLSAEAFDKYLARYPDDAKRGDALYFRAMLWRLKKENEKAAALLKDAPAPTLIAPHLVGLLNGQLLIDMGKYEDAVKFLEAIPLTDLDDKVKASLLHMRGLAYRGGHNYDAAAAQFQEVAKLSSPLKARAMLELARVKALTGKVEDAINALNQTLAMKDRTISPEAARLAGDLSYKTGKYPRAINFYRLVLNDYLTSKHFGPSLLGMMWAQLAANQHLQLIGTYQQNYKKLEVKDRVIAHYLAGRAYQEQDKHDKAIGLLGLVANFSAGTGLEDKATFQLAVSYFKLQKFDEMSKAVAKLRKDFPQSPLIADGAFLIAQARVEQNQVGSAADELKRLIDEGPKNDYYSKALLARARLFDSQDQNSAAIDDFQSFIKFAAANPKKVSASDVDQSSLSILTLQYKLKEFGEATKTAEQLMGKEKLDPRIEAEAMYYLMLVQIKLEEFPQALATISHLRKKHPLNQFVDMLYYYRGMLLMASKKTDDAIPELKTASAAEQVPKELRANAMMLLFGLQEKSDPDAAAITLRALNTLNKELALKYQLWLARYYESRSKPTTALEYLDPILESHAKTPLPDSMYTEVLLLKGRSLRLMDDAPGATKLFRQLVSMGKGAEQAAKIELARTLAEGGLKEKEEALKQFQPLLVSRDRSVAAMAHFESGLIYRHFSDDRRRASDLVGFKKHTDSAEEMFRRLVLLYSEIELSPYPELSHIELAEVLSDVGQDDRAAKVYAQLLKKFEKGPYAQYAKAMVALSQKQVPQAKALLKQLQQGQLDERLEQRIIDQLTKLE
jgi:tetratricopeptide (TPR) repeat protein